MFPYGDSLYGNGDCSFGQPLSHAPGAIALPKFLAPKNVFIWGSPLKLSSVWNIYVTYRYVNIPYWLDGKMFFSLDKAKKLPAIFQSVGTLQVLSRMSKCIFYLPPPPPPILGCVFVLDGMDFLILVFLCLISHFVVTSYCPYVPSNYKIRTNFYVVLPGRYYRLQYPTLNFTR
jgi:hypothetical protein